MKPRKKCRSCGTTRKPSKHHVVPKRHGTDGVILWLCRDCHDLIEDIILEEETWQGKRCKLAKARYYEIALEFIQ